MTICGVVLVGCGQESSDTGESPAGAAPQTTAHDDRQTTQAQTASPTAAQTTEPGSDVDDASATSDQVGQAPDASSRVELSGGSSLVIEPTEVYCSGEPGGLRHVVGKTDNEPPLVEVDRDGFVLVKVQQGRPWRAEDVTGLAWSDDGVELDDVDLGDVTANGTLICTDYED